MPDVRVIKIGGQSIMDRGRAALFPILDEIIEARKRGVQVVVLVGGGTRARHIYAIASELEMPTGVIATLGKYIPMQNARMLQMILAKHGGLFMLPDDFEKLPLYLSLGCIPVMSGMPPFGYWEKREGGSRIPPHRTDAGVFLSAEFLGARRALFIKDEDGLYTDDPKKNPSGDAHPADHGEGADRAEPQRRRRRAHGGRVPAPRAVVQGAAGHQRSQAGKHARRARRQGRRHDHLGVAAVRTLARVHRLPRSRAPASRSRAPASRSCTGFPVACTHSRVEGSPHW